MKRVNAVLEQGRVTLTRRNLMLLGAGALLLPRAFAGGKSSSQLLVSASGDQRASYGLSWAGTDGSRAGSALSGFRGHGVALLPGEHEVLMFARRPGRECLRVNLRSGEAVLAFQCADNRHLFGHGCLSHDGRWLYTTETNLDNDQGLIVVRDTERYAIQAEFPSNGIGPHEVCVLKDGSLVVANGGILTRPESGRRMLNLDSMQPNLSYIDAQSGALLESVAVAEAKASIRHIAVADDDTVAIAMQMQRAASGHSRAVSLTALHRRGEAMTLLPAPPQLWAQMQDYVGSVVINNASRLAGFTSPRGNVAAFWHIDDARLVGYHRLHDVCGIAVSGDQSQFVLTGSAGHVRVLDGVTLRVDNSAGFDSDTPWDNHLLLLQG